MRLLEAIVAANQQARSYDEVALDLQPFGDSLPIIALTCIDPRLNKLFPHALGVPEDQFIWLRNAGNIIFDPLSSMTRTLALASAIKGGKEIAIIGHTDCKVGKTSIAELTDRFKAAGVDRSRLPDNLHDFFGLFASERQNVIHGTEFVRQSPLIGSKVPVHGLIIDVNTGKLEWVVNGYQAFATSISTAGAATAELTRHDGIVPLPEFKIGEMKFPEIKIGEITSPAAPVSQSVSPQPVAVSNPNQEIRRLEAKRPQVQEVARAGEQKNSPLLRIARSQMYKVMGDDQKVYGPVLGREIERWINEGRIDLNTLAQKVGYKNWKRLADFAEEMEHVATPPALPPEEQQR
jgi:carbonic anhydrase